MKTIALIVIILATLIRLEAQDVSPGITFTDGQRLTAAQLGQLVSLATINTTFYTTKVSQGAPVSGDTFLVYSASSGTFHKLTAQSLLYGNTGIIANQTPYSTMSDYSTFLFYDPTNLWLGQITKSNLARVISSGVTVSNLVLWTTNGSNVPVYPIAFSADSTNNQLNILVFDTNGVPNYITASNFLAQVYDYQFTNRYENYVYRQMFLPWTLYNTNTTDFTNAWGTKTNFPITSLYMTNAYNPTNTTPQILPTDTIPFYSGGQQTNTTVTVDAIYSYMTNLNALPNYNNARVIFNGNPLTRVIANTVDTTLEVISNTGTATGLGNGAAISFLNGTAASSLPTPLTTNQVYYFYGVASNSFMLWSNYADCVISNSATKVNITGNGANTTTLYSITNFTQLNADVTCVNSGTSRRTGVYDVWFRTNSPTPYYYVNLTAPEDGSGTPVCANISGDLIVTTNRFRIAISRAGGAAADLTPVHVSVFPQ